MSSLIKFLIIVVSFGVFVYAASLAFQGELEMVRIVSDINIFVLYSKDLFSTLTNLAL